MSDMHAEVRFANREDARREMAVAAFKRHVRADPRIKANYDADIEYMEYALLAFADEWAVRHGRRQNGASGVR